MEFTCWSSFGVVFLICRCCTHTYGASLLPTLRSGVFLTDLTSPQAAEHIPGFVVIELFQSTHDRILQRRWFFLHEQRRQAVSTQQWRADTAITRTGRKGSKRQPHQYIKQPRGVLLFVFVLWLFSLCERGTQSPRSDGDAIPYMLAQRIVVHTYL